MSKLRYFEKGNNGLELRLQHVSETIPTNRDINSDNAFAKAVLAEHLDMLDRYEAVSYEVNKFVKATKNENKRKIKLH